MAIGKAARWISFSTPQQTPSSSAVAHDTDHSTHSIADEKQFGLENVRDLDLRFQQTSRLSDFFFDPVKFGNTW
jgi:hypothetical protein